MGRGPQAARGGSPPARLGETVLFVLPGHENEGQEFDCDRELVSIDDQWVLRSL